MDSRLKRFAIRAGFGTTKWWQRLAPGKQRRAPRVEAPPGVVIMRHTSDEPSMIHGDEAQRVATFHACVWRPRDCDSVNHVAARIDGSSRGLVPIDPGLRIGSHSSPALTRG
jgi:hypothetical protein